jgi:hypothetical protein
MGTPKSFQIPARFPHWLRSRPALLSATVSRLNRLRRLTATRRRLWLIGAALGLAATLVWIIVASAATARAIAEAVNHPALVVATAGLYSALLIPRRRRAAAAARARSWLVATPRAPDTRGVAMLAGVLASLVVRWLGVAVLLLLVSLNTAVTLQQLVMLLVLLTAGGAAGAAFGGLTRTPPR